MPGRILSKTLLSWFVCLALIPGELAWQVSFKLRLPSTPGLAVLPDVQLSEPRGVDVRLTWNPESLTGLITGSVSKPPTSVLLNVDILSKRYAVSSSVLAFTSERARAEIPVPVAASDLPTVNGLIFKPGNRTNGFVATVSSPMDTVRLTAFGFNVMDNGGGCFHPNRAVYDLKLTIQGDKILGGTATRPGEPYSTTLVTRFIDDCNHQILSKSQQFVETLDKGSREIAFTFSKLQIVQRSGSAAHDGLLKSFGTGESDLCVHFLLGDSKSQAEIWGLYLPGATPQMDLVKARVACAPLWLPRLERF